MLTNLHQTPSLPDRLSAQTPSASDGSESLVDVRDVTFANLFNITPLSLANDTYQRPGVWESDHTPLPLAIDAYQRPYVWGTEKAALLLSDLRDFLKDAPLELDYYMGTVLLHQTSEKLFIIDGQQRLTTLCLLYRQFHGKVPELSALSYRNPESWNNIKRTTAHFAETSTILPEIEILSRIRFTVITVNSEDLAFTFFDTQNSRGVPLGATDILKAFHLRAIRNPDVLSLNLQRNCAARWEHLQKIPQLLSTGKDFAHSLFQDFLWRARCWTGNAFDSRPSHEALIQEFQIESLAFEKSDSDSLPDTVPLYSSRGNRRASALTLVPGDGYRLHAEEIRLSNDPADLPFALRQPIRPGVGFFLYAEKYASLAHRLVGSTHDNPEVCAFQNFHSSVMAHVSIYIQELFLLASVMFVDQFGYRKLLEFALWLDYALGAIRIEKAYVFKEAPMNFLKQQPRNLLDIISSAFRPEEPINYLKSLPDPPRIYATKSVQGSGVQFRYQQSVLDYYKRSGSLGERHHWINDKWMDSKLKQGGLS